MFITPEGSVEMPSHLTIAIARRMFSGLLLVVCLAGSSGATAAEKYQRPPADILNILGAPTLPQVLLNPPRDHFLIFQGTRYPSISELAEPMAAIAGQRINTQNNGPHRPATFTSLTLKSVATGKEQKIVLPPGSRIGTPVWSGDGKHFAFIRYTGTELELWAGEVANPQVRRLRNVTLNGALGSSFDWMPDNHTLLCRTIPAKRGNPPYAPRVPASPHIQETTGTAAPARTYQDLIESPYDEQRLDYYGMSQLALVDTRSGKIDLIGAPGLFTMAEPSPEGRLLLVERRQKPYSYQFPLSGFPRLVEIWSIDGKVLHTVGNIPSAETVPAGGVTRGPRQYHWLPTDPGTLVWVEALDNGDPKVKSPYRDRVLVQKILFEDEPHELVRTEQRFASLLWGDRPGIALLRDFQASRKWSRTFVVRTDSTNAVPELLWERSTEDRYSDPGAPLMRTLPNGLRALRVYNGSIFLAGTGASAEGVRPFLDLYNLTTKEPRRLFQSDEQSYESVIGLATDDGATIVTRREALAETPNYWMRSTTGARSFPLTSFGDPAPQFRQVRHQVMTCERDDGIQLTFNLYLPPGYEPGQRVPTILWAYPREFSDADNAAQVTTPANRFTTVSGASHLFLLLQGYAVIDASGIPIVGSARKRNDTFIEQIVSSARAIVAKSVEAGVTDPERVGVGGHSYGAFMAANLLAHTDLFRAGVARSGAYNRTLTPFGFQNEPRNYWEATETYNRMSPFVAADKINEPLLLIHGEEDSNPGTFPLQSERLFQAIKGLGGTSRLVLLPLENHNYEARESIEHTLAEMVAWFDRYVKNAAPRPPVESPAQPAR
ncbi:MAG TPA: prolyl oligopeptidase family serine peptidase [Roseimicrobium sp.]|nr:prolyl oligopeptidase family serine peptidase [Roseimicrobium sp.]